MYKFQEQLGRTGGLCLQLGRQSTFIRCLATSVDQSLSFLKNFYRFSGSSACPAHTGLNCPLKPNRVFSLSAFKLIIACILGSESGLQALKFMASPLLGNKVQGFRWPGARSSRWVVYILIALLLEAPDGCHPGELCCSAQGFQGYSVLPPKRRQCVLKPHQDFLCKKPLKYEVPLSPDDKSDAERKKTNITALLPDGTY